MPLQFFGQTTTVLQQQVFSVWLKRGWSHAWQWVPGLEFVKGRMCAGPDTSDATFCWRYGEVMYPEFGAIQYCTPWQIAGSYVAVMGHRPDGNWPAWIGRIDTEQFDMNGVINGILPDGVQTFLATGLEDLLDRRIVRGTYTDDPVNPYIDRVVPFNERFARGMTPSGNRSANRMANGAYAFSADGYEWTALQALEYVYANFLPELPPFQLAGQLEVLDQFLPVMDPDGMSALKITDQFVDHRRGLGRHIVTDGVGPVYVEVFSTLQESFAAGGVVMPANPYPVLMDFTAYPDVKPHIMKSGVHQYDTIVVESEELIKVCATYDAAADAVVPAWSEDDQTGYKAADDNERSTDKYRRVWTTYRVNPAVDWTGVAPLVDGFGGYTLDAAGPLWSVGKGFEDWIPFEDSSTDELQNRQFRKMFALVADEEGYYYYIDRLSQTVFKKAGDCGVRATERGLGVEILVSPNHVLALNRWDGAADSEIQPMFDYSTLCITAMLETDSRVQVVLPLWGSLVSETGKTLHIRVPRAETWLVAAGTVTDVEDGERIVTEAPQVIRDDSDKVLAVAGAALACYGQQQAMLELEMQQAAPVCGPGALIVGAWSGWQYSAVGSVVTEVAIDGQKGYAMTIRTSQRNIDYKMEGLLS